MEDKQAKHQKNTSLMDSVSAVLTLSEKIKLYSSNSNRNLQKCNCGKEILAWILVFDRS